MVDIAAAPFALRDARLIIEPGAGEEREFSSSVSHVLFDPRVEWIEDSKFARPERTYIMGRTEWWLALEYPQDWGEASSLSLFLALHAGETRDLLFVPSETLATHQVRATVVLAPGPIGGDAGPMLTGVVAMPLRRAPIFEER